jgi:hypothetical protein
MKTFTCTCGQLVFFENVFCVACKKQLGFLPDSLTLSTIEPTADGLFAVVGQTIQNRLYKKCQNYDSESVCNWMIPVEDSTESFCQSCRLNQVIPDLSSGRNLGLWALMESAKRRLIYSLITLGLPLKSKIQDPQNGLAFCFLSDTVNPDGSANRILTGHDNGTITLNIAEADDGFREQTRLSMKEPYRTLLGHFRHEIGHYYWDRLVPGSEFIDRFRELFGDERQDYDQALQTYYANSAPANWQDHHISAYSTAHPWEDWAESWAHLMHIRDTLEVADDFGLKGKRIYRNLEGTQNQPTTTSEPDEFERMIQEWLELIVVLNSINRSMGHPDLYPFVLSVPVIEKLRFISETIAVSTAIK